MKLYVIQGGDIGPGKKEIQLEPMPESEPQREVVPLPTPAPQEVPSEEPVPA